MVRVFLIATFFVAAWFALFLSGRALLIEEQRFAFGASGRVLLVCTYAGALGSVERRFETDANGALARSGCPGTVHIGLRTAMADAAKSAR